MCESNKNLFITDGQNIYVYDRELNQLNKKSQFPVNGLHYDLANEKLYASNVQKYKIFILNDNLDVVDSFDVPSDYYIDQISVFNKTVYLGTGGGMILIYQNKAYVKTVSGMYIDYDGYLFVTCYFLPKIELYKINEKNDLTFIAKKELNKTYALKITVDSMGRIIFFFLADSISFGSFESLGFTILG